MNKQETLEKLYATLSHDNDESEASCYGLTKAGDGLEFIKLRTNKDIYDLLQSIDADKLHTNFDYITIITYGWAAPLKNGEVDGMPSEHPERRRVRLTISADVKEKEIIGSAMKLDGDDEVMYDLNQATGLLADSLLAVIEG